jgi:hypothetical protein
MINYFQLTKQYYSNWLNINANEMDKEGIVLIETNKRKVCPKGHPKNLELYAVANNSSLFISFSPDINSQMQISHNISKSSTIDAGIAKLKEVFREKLHHRKAHYFTELPDGIDTSEVTCLKRENYPDYLKFFTRQNPNASPDGWLEEYFISISDNKRCYGIYKDNNLVCATGAPDIPFMEGIITEPSIDTLKEYRSRGYAQAVCAEYLKNATSRNEVPIWTCWHSNVASYRLAEKLGYKFFGDLYTIEGNIPYEHE